jgi:hypothetical protein
MCAKNTMTGLDGMTRDELAALVLELTWAVDEAIEAGAGDADIDELNGARVEAAAQLLESFGAAVDPDTGECGPVGDVDEDLAWDDGRDGVEPTSIPMTTAEVEQMRALGLVS